MAITDLPTGIDNQAPIKNWDQDQNLNMMFAWWALDQIWMGQEGKGKYIPKVLDYVQDRQFHITYVVESLDDLFRPKLVRVTPRVTADLDSEDVLVGQTKDTFRVWVDKDVFPYRLQVDGRAWVNARNARFARVFRGNPLTGTAEVVSLTLDSAGQVLSTLIPLEQAVLRNGTNIHQWYVPQAFTKHDLKNGEMCYVVLYNAEARELTAKELRVVEGGFVIDMNRPLDAVIGLALDSPLMSKTIPGRLEIPLNMTLNTLNMKGVVNYQSGAPKQHVVDGQRFSLQGLECYIPSQPGDLTRMGLKYIMTEDEVSFVGGQIGAERSILVPIEVQTVEVNPSITARLYCYPVWQNQASGYRLKWFMSNLDRNMLYDVTSMVELGPNSSPFIGTLYGSLQNLDFVLNLQQVNGQFPNWNHIQTVGITLMRAGNSSGDKWSIRVSPNQEPVYGIGCVAKTKFINQNQTQVNLISGATTKDEWLEKFYYNTKPIFNDQIEGPDRAIAPTHFVIMHGNSEMKVSVDNWDKTQLFLSPLPQDDTLFIKFVRQGVNRDIVLSVAGVVIDQTL
jgi:hypothetical protein